MIEKEFYNFEFIQILLALRYRMDKLEENWKELDMNQNGKISLIDLYLSFKGFYPGNSIGKDKPYVYCRQIRVK